MGRPFALKEVSAFPYVLKKNRKDPVDEQVTFMLTGLSGRQRGDVRQKIYSAVQEEPGDPGKDRKVKVSLADNYEAAELAAVYGLTGWKNLTNEETGKDIEFPDRGGREAVQMLPESVVQELALKIMAASELTEGERGN